jgi:hypothetical protein
VTAAAVLDRWSIDTDVDAKTTLLRMERMARRAVTAPDVVHSANAIITGARSRDYPAQIGAIRSFMERSFRFVTNPIGTQTIRPPGYTSNPRAPGMLQDIEARGFTQGACDDAALLIAVLGMGNGIPARFRAIAFCSAGECSDTEPFSHVVTDLHDGERWVALDVTRPFDMLRAPEIARELTLIIA